MNAYRDLSPWLNGAQIPVYVHLRQDGSFCILKFCCGRRKGRAWNEGDKHGGKWQKINF